MKSISFKRDRFPPNMIRHAVWLYFRFSLNFRDVEELLAQRGIEEWMAFFSDNEGRPPTLITQARPSP